MEYFPETLEDVIQIVTQARKNRTPLYPISTGRNWGYGPPPHLHGGAIVNLGRMRRILNPDDISPTMPVALIQPGVTQGDLFDFLNRHQPALTFNVTGSAVDTSLMGNALDGGVGYLGPRREDLFGLEIVTGTGEVLQTGFRRLGDDSPLRHSHPFGLGPSLDGLFFQGNFGIVTSACFRLTPRRPCEVAVSLALREPSHLARFIDELGRLKRDGLMNTVTHVADRARTHATLLHGIARDFQQRYGQDRATALASAARTLKLVAPGEWTSLASVRGNSAQVRACLSEIRHRMKQWASMRVVTSRRLAMGEAWLRRFDFIPWARAYAAALTAMQPLHGLALGVPTDVAVDNLLWAFDRPDLPASRFDESPCGLLYINPALPLNGKLVSDIIARLQAIAAQHQHTAYTTINIETATSLVAVINLLYDRRIPEEVTRAHRCADALWEEIRHCGLEVYRARADMMPGVVARNPEYWATVRTLKQALDPDNIIAPGRYNLPD